MFCTDPFNLTSLRLIHNIWLTLKRHPALDGFVIDKDEISYLLAGAIAIIPMASAVYKNAVIIKTDTIRLLNKGLRHVCFAVEKSEWNDTNDRCDIEGTCYDDKFVIQVGTNTAYIRILDLPWGSISVNDPNMPTLLEAINNTNEQFPNCSVCLSDPDDKGMRLIFTSCVTILPTHRTGEYFGSVIRTMLNCKRALSDNVNRPRPWMKKQRGPIGFATPSASATTPDTDSAAPASPSVSDPIPAAPAAHSREQ